MLFGFELTALHAFRRVRRSVVNGLYGPPTGPPSFLELAYKFTLLNHQTLEGPIVAEIDALTSKNKITLSLYKKYKGKLDETLKDLTYIKSIQLNPPNPNAPPPTPTSKKLPLIY